MMDQNKKEMYFPEQENVMWSYPMEITSMVTLVNHGWILRWLNWVGDLPFNNEQNKMDLFSLGNRHISVKETLNLYSRRNNDASTWCQFAAFSACSLIKQSCRNPAKHTGGNLDGA